MDKRIVALVFAIDYLMAELDTARNEYPGEYENFVTIGNVEDAIESLRIAAEETKGAKDEHN